MASQQPTWLHHYLGPEGPACSLLWPQAKEKVGVPHREAAMPALTSTASFPLVIGTGPLYKH